VLADYAGLAPGLPADYAGSVPAKKPAKKEVAKKNAARK
jgi:hypothetical protein